MAVKGVSIGMMNKRVILSYPTVTTDDSGGREVTYSDHAPVWAFVRKKNGYRSVEANMDGSEATHEFFIRNSSVTTGIEKKWIIKHDDRQFIIQDIEKISDIRPYLKITVYERESINESDS